MSLSLDLRFTDPAAPLFIDVEGDNSETLFVISTSQVHGAVTGAPSQRYHASGNKKRDRDETPADTRNKKPMKAVQKVGSRTPSVPHALVPGSAATSVSARSSQREMHDDTMPPPSFIPLNIPPARPGASREPLFLPTSSQLSVIDEAVLKSTGLGIESMDANELADMLEGEGEEVAFDFASQDPDYHNFLERPGNAENGPDSFELADEAAEIPPTQTSAESKVNMISSTRNLYAYSHCRCSKPCLKTSDRVYTCKVY